MARFPTEGITTPAQAAGALKAQGEKIEFKNRCGRVTIVGMHLHFNVVCKKTVQLKCRDPER